LWIGLIFGGLLVLTVTTLALVLYFATKKGPQDNSIQASIATLSGANAPLSDPTLSPPNQPEPAAWLPPEEQTQVNKAIDRGVTYLKKNQGHDGGWGQRVGLTALPGLTLLECGVPADDICIQKALNHVRGAVPHLNQTYDLALSILFLNRLGDPNDEKLIQTCALRLVAGQSQTGGWTYHCPALNPAQVSDLLTVMEQTRPRNSLDLFVGDPNRSAPLGGITQDSGTSGKDTLGNSADSKLLTPGSTVPLDGKSIEKGLRDEEAYKKALARLPANLRSLPALQPPKKSHKMPAHDGTDNSNTQFAILGLSAALKHNLPLERSLALIAQRFRKSEARKGGWAYHYAAPTADRQVTYTMTGAGLLGLAVGLGLVADHTQPQPKGGRVADPGIEKGFNFLGGCIGKPAGVRKSRKNKLPAINFYLLWSVERCGVLFNRREIAGKDWYSWGVELLLDHQSDNGSWRGGSYPGAVPMADTCFALLFLKRANLAKDLTKKLEFFMEGKKLQGP